MKRCFERICDQLYQLRKPKAWKRLAFFLVFDALIVFFSLYSAILIRFEFVFPEQYGLLYRWWAPGLAVIWMIFLYYWGLYRINWRFVSIIELKNVILATLSAATLVISFDYMLLKLNSPLYISRGVLLISFVFVFTLIWVLRIAKRLYFLFIRGYVGKGTLLVGANGISERLVMELLSGKENLLSPRIILDPDPLKNKTKIHGIPVLSDFSRIRELVRRYEIETVLINLRGKDRKRIVDVFDAVQEAGVKDIRVVPSVDEYGSDVYRAKSFKQLAIEDLLAREPVVIDFLEVRDFLSGKVVLVTGAAGSIGSEIVRKLLDFEVERIVSFEIDETELFNLEREMSGRAREGSSCDLVFVLGDVRDDKKLEGVFAQYHPDIVFHAAAYKHVPVLEEFPEEAVKTNIIGTYHLADFARRHGAEKLINISTDKAVNPGSVMGASKRMAEMACSAVNNNKTRQISVRFGNVLGSRGSVIPIFLEQIRKGEAVTVTHPDMKRYFMSIPEAVLLVFQAACMGEGGEVFVLDMGEPVRIIDLASNLIKMNGLIPEVDVDIRFTGIRPGEKLFEELLTAEEGTVMTTHAKIFAARISDLLPEEGIRLFIEEFGRIDGDASGIRQLLSAYVPQCSWNLDDGDTANSVCKEKK